MLLQPIINIAEICAQKNVKEIILSPGSRCAPLTLAFVRHPQINTRTISDERSAAFIALGIAQQTRNPSALVSTSGTAALNYAPAVAEAFYQNIPLIIFTADRPPEWIGQHDGQTIRQKEIYGKNCKASYELPVDYAHPDAAWQIERIVSEAINISKTYPHGPVHINVPVREPFYPSENERFEYSNIKVIDRVESEQNLTDEAWNKLFKIFQASPKKLVVAGLQPPNQKLHQILDDFQKSTGIPVITDINSNLHGLQNAIQHIDIICSGQACLSTTKLQPDLLITFGGPVISKSLKIFLRKYPAKAHWNIQPAGNVADTFKSLTDIINVTPECFFSEISVRWKHLTPLAVKAWMDQEQKAQNF
ncbi:MAG: 2-succinyl-5-enolpyruvyl-6-hydroxy-3-cyclohexene-1-carboxylic-acid synthase, partial [Bacteroidetes bacterium]|nr:2-succinyl-5-enolpyruvyl-6-hydroxy-3-cyclohexene-1-carboxylic-acid synthase [Bacteroidota bacterium]